VRHNCLEICVTINFLFPPVDLKDWSLHDRNESMVGNGLAPYVLPKILLRISRVDFGLPCTLRRTVNKISWKGAFQGQNVKFIRACQLQHAWMQMLQCLQDC